MSKNKSMACTISMHCHDNKGYTLNLHTLTTVQMILMS